MNYSSEKGVQSSGRVKSLEWEQGCNVTETVCRTKRKAYRKQLVSCPSKTQQNPVGFHSVPSGHSKVTESSQLGDRKRSHLKDVSAPVISGLVPDLSGSQIVTERDMS